MLLCITGDLHYNSMKYQKSIMEKFFSEMCQQEWDVLIDTGDTSSHELFHLKRFFEHLRSHTKKPVLRVNGNHDYWSIEIYVEHMEMQRNWHQKYDIQYLPDKSWENEEVKIVGFDGWYALENPPTNDEMRLCPGILMSTLSQKANDEFHRVIDEIKECPKKCVVVTHFVTHDGPRILRAMNGAYHMFPEMVQHAKVLCEGHTHLASDFMEGACRVLNAGSDYDMPRFKIIEV